MTFALRLLLILALYVGTAEAQTYVRPSDGTVLTIFDNVDYPTASATSQVFNMSGFSGVTFYLTTSANNCTKIPAIVVEQSSSSSGFLGIVAAAATNSAHQSISQITQSHPEVWTVAPLSGYVRIYITGVTNHELSPPPGNACRATLKMVPLAFQSSAVAKGGESGRQYINASPSRVAGLGSVFTNVSHFRLQNVSTSTIVCGLNPQISLNPAFTPVTTGIVLKKDSVGGGAITAAGDGGVLDLDAFGAVIYCVSNGGGLGAELLWMTY